MVETVIEVLLFSLNRLKNVGDCKQSIQITDGSSSATFDCSRNNDLLPELLHTSTGHFLTINFVNNLGTAGGKFFIQIQGSNPAGDITLSCGSSALSVPVVDASSLPICPVNGETTTVTPSSESSTISTQSSTESSITSTTVDSTSIQTSTSVTTLSSTESSNTSTTPYSSTTDVTTISTETSSLSGANTTPFVSNQSSNVSSTWESTTLSFESSSLADLNTTSVTLTNTTQDVNSTAFNTSDMTPEFTTLPWTSTENNSNASVVAANGQPPITEKTPDYIIAVVMAVVFVAILALLLFYRDRLKELFCKKKKAETENNKDDENPLFQINIAEHSRFQSLPPLRHEFKLPKTDIDTPRPITREHELYRKAQKRHENRALQRLTDKSWRKDNRDEIEKQENRQHKTKETNVIKAKNDINLIPMNGIPSNESQDKQNSSDAVRKQTGKKKKAKKGKGRNKVTQGDDVTPIAKELTPSNLSFSLTGRRPSVTIDISDSEGILQKTVYFD